MSDYSKKQIEMQKIEDEAEEGKETNENFETNEPLRENHSRQGSQFDLLDRLVKSSEQKMATDLVKKEKHKKPERLSADKPPMQTPPSFSLIDEEIKAEGTRSKQQVNQEIQKRSSGQVLSMIEHKDDRELETNKGS